MFPGSLELQAKRRKRHARKLLEAANPSHVVARNSYIAETAGRVVDFFPGAWPEGCVGIVFEFLVPLQITVDYCGLERSLFHRPEGGMVYILPGWMPLKVSFEKTCKRAGTDPVMYVLKDKHGLQVVPTTTIWNDYALGAEHAQFTVCFRK